MAGEPESIERFPRMGACALKVLVIGKGGREHALCWKLKQSPRSTTVFWRRATRARRSTGRTWRSSRATIRGLGPVRQARGDRPDGRRPGGAARQGDRRRLSARGPADLRPAQGSGRARREQGLRQGADAAGGNPHGRLSGLPLGARRRALRPLARGGVDRPLAGPLDAPAHAALPHGRRDARGHRPDHGPARDALARRSGRDRGARREARLQHGRRGA